MFGWLRLQRVGFWRAMLDSVALLGICSLLLALSHPYLGSPLGEIIGFSSLILYPLAVWRLEPGRGRLWWRIGRVLLWTLLFSMLSGLVGYLIIQVMPYPQSLLGVELPSKDIGLGLYLISSLLIVSGIFLPTRALITLWISGQQRLRWRFVASYLLVGILSIVLVPLALSLYLGVISLSVSPPVSAPQVLTEQLSAQLAPLLREELSSDELSRLLDQIIAGDARLVLPASGDFGDVVLPSAGQLQRLSLLDPDGLVLASSGEAPFAPNRPLPEPTATELQLLLYAAADGCAEARPADGLIGDSAACPLRDQAGAVRGVLLLESTRDSSLQIGAIFGRLIGMILLTTSLTLNLSLLVVVMVMPLAIAVGYGLARPLTRRIERLAEASSGIAAGDLARRVVVDSQDEIGRLGAAFNRMAEQLEEREQALAASAAQAEALLKANKQLVADVSHELRNPLATLRGHLELLEQEHRDRLPTADLSVIGREMERLTGLVEDLFTLARAEARQLPLQIVPVDPTPLLRNLGASLAPLARREREIELVVDLPDHLPFVQADAARLEQVIRNLAQNALRYTPPGGIIAFTATVGPESVTLSVIDTGSGISPEELERVFERFYRSDSSRARETGGAGLGLSLVHELVSAMGGTVQASSELGRGSRFSVELPRAAVAVFA